MVGVYNITCKALLESLVNKYFASAVKDYLAFIINPSLLSLLVHDVSWLSD
jgi:hypothetical protein